jgi:hypothetical protein
MKIYSVLYHHSNPLALVLVNLLKQKNIRILISYASLPESTFSLQLVSVANQINRLFLDSGAFSVYTRGEQIDIDAYIDFIRKKNIKLYANLDVIKNAEATLENQRYMEKQGLNPLPCFHIEEPFDFFEYYIKNYEYIGIGVAKS